MASLGEKVKKRSTSIITIFLWLLLISVMSTIMIGSIVERNKIGYDTTIIVKMDFTDVLADDSISEYDKQSMINTFYNDLHFVDYNGESSYKKSTYLGLEGNIASYQLEFNKANVNYIQIYERLTLDDKFHILENGNLLNQSGAYFVTEFNPDRDVYEFTVKPDLKIKVSIDYTETILFPFDVYLTQENGKNDRAISVDYWSTDEGIGTFNVSVIPNLDYSFNFQFDIDELTDHIQYIVYDENGIALTESDGNYVKAVAYDSGKQEYQFKVVSNGNSDIPGIYSDIQWVDKEKQTALLEYRVGKYFYNEHAGQDEGYVVFAEKLADGFTISSEYEGQSDWLIVNEDEIINMEFTDLYNCLILNLDNNKYIPEHVYANFFGSPGYPFIIEWNGKYQYIYLKDKNILYTILDYPGSYQTIKLQYNGNTESNTDLTVNLETKVIHFYDDYKDSCYHATQQYIGNELVGKSLKVAKNTSANIEINRLVEDEKENGVYYVGLFENEGTSKTDHIYLINTVDGVGKTVITIENYDGIKPYYIYEVDEHGNKISDEEITYSKNQILENALAQEEKEIISDKNVVSMVGTFDQDVVGSGLGEEYYKNNTISTNTTYQDVVTISSKYKEVYTVKFEAEEGGTIEGETSVIVKAGGTVGTIANAVANEHYSFDKWVVVEDGVEIEVDPGSYIITKDTIFIAKFKKNSYNIKYETEDNGRLEGSLEEKVEYGESPVSVPAVVPDEGYEFDKWVIIEDGKEMEVNPKSYIVTKDITLIAKFKPVEIIDTSDIAIWPYVGIGIISILVIAIIVILIVIKKKNKNK